MNLLKQIGRERRRENDELNITPLMNIFLILVPFLLLTAVFVRISILEFSLPVADEKQAGHARQKAPVVIILQITENGFDLKTTGKKIPFIPKKLGNFDYQNLQNRLLEIKTEHVDSEDIILAPGEVIKYDTIIKVMDHCRENGFLNISITA
jgi:biopolymer transport protein ExbD